MTRILRNGILAGLAAGACLAVVLAAFGEAVIGRAVRLEEAVGGGGAGQETFARPVQQLGGALGALLYGAVLGIVFAAVFAAVRHRLPARTDFRRAVLLAAAGWLGAVAVPFVLYPPNPPGVGDPATITERTAAYLVALAWGLAAVAVTARLAGDLRARGWSEPAWVAASGGCFIALVVLAGAVLPAPAPVGGLPADLVWSFRLRSLAGTTASWAVLGLAFGALPVVAAGKDAVRA